MKKTWGKIKYEKRTKLPFPEMAKRGGNFVSTWTQFSVRWMASGEGDGDGEGEGEDVEAS